jgi:UDP-glucose 6-dehydrogenase
MKLYQALIAGLVACSFAFAAQDSAVAKTVQAHKGKKDMVWGKVVSVDAVANILIVKTKKGDDTLSTTDKTEFLPKGTTIADFKADDRVAASFKMEDGKMVATKVILNPPHKEKKAPAAPTAPETGSNSAK